MVRIAVQHEPGFYPIAGARELYPLDATASVLARQLLGRRARRLKDARIEDELLRCSRVRRIDVRDRLRGRLDGGLAGALRTGTRDDPLLSGAEPDDRDGRDPERKNDGQDRLTAFVVHGVHSTLRAAVPSMIKRGSPTNPSGSGIA